MDRKIGCCSICGGDVVAYEGPWMATVPPPPPHCTDCGAEAADSERVIKMKRSGRQVGFDGSINHAPYWSSWGVR